MASVIVQPSAPTLAVGTTITVDVRVLQVEKLHSLSLMLIYNPAVLKFQESHEGDFMNQGGTATGFSVSAPQGGREVRVDIIRTGSAEGASGSGTLCTLVFSGAARGTSPLAMGAASMKDPNGQAVNSGLLGSQVEVQ
jgi:general secretion pathway protein D